MIDLVQEGKELGMRMAGVAGIDHVALQDIEGGKQRRRPVPRVVMRLPGRQPWPQEQHGLGPIQVLEIWLFSSTLRTNAFAGGFMQRPSPETLDTFAGERGLRVGIARALYHDPDLVVMDAATSSIDVETEREISAAIEHLRRDKAIVIIAHRQSTIQKLRRHLHDGCGRLVETAANARIEG